MEYRYMIDETEYENEGEWTKTELRAMEDEAESEIYRIQNLINNLEQELWYAEERHQQATYLLDNNLWHVEDSIEEKEEE